MTARWPWPLLLLVGLSLPIVAGLMLHRALDIYGR